MRKKYKYDRGLTKIPAFEHIALEDIMTRADVMENVITFDSDINSMSYVANKENLLIITRRSGTLAVPIDGLSDMIEELRNIEWIVKRWHG